MILVRFKNTFRDRLPEWISAAALIIWGLLILSESPELWANEYFKNLGYIASQKSWGLVAVGVGFLRFVSLVINGAWRPTAHLRALGALAGILIWSSVIVGYIGLDWNPPALASKGALMISDVFALWFAAGDAKLADIKAQKLRSNGASSEVE